MKIDTFIRISTIGLCILALLVNCKLDKNTKDMKWVSITENGIESDFEAKPSAATNFEKAADHFKAHPKRWETAFQFLIESDLDTLALGNHELSKDVFAIVSEYSTRDLDSTQFESHKERIDLQYLVSGRERIGHVRGDLSNVVTPYSKEKDIMFYDHQGGEMLKASPDNYFIFFPNDNHRPCIVDTGSEMVRKIVLKIRYD